MSNCVKSYTVVCKKLWKNKILMAYIWAPLELLRKLKDVTKISKYFFQFFALYDNFLHNSKSS